MEIGTKGKKTFTVTDEFTAARVRSGLLPVYATPCMIAAMEEVCAASVAKFLGEGDTTVGISVNIKHTSATVVGKKVTVTSELLETDGRKLTFAVCAADEAGQIGIGHHERFIVNSEKFMQKANEKK